MSSVIYYATDGKVTPRALDVLRLARGLAYGEEEVDFVEASPGVGALNFGYFPDIPDQSVRTMSMSEVAQVPNAHYIVAAAMKRYAHTLEYRSPKPGANVLWMDIEAGSVDDRWNVPLEEYFKLGQYAWNEEPVVLTEDYQELQNLMLEADVVVAHQGHQFDFSVMFGKDSTVPLEMARDGRLFDTKVFAGYTFPAPATYRRRNGHWQAKASAPANAKHGWLGLDNLAYQFGVAGKEGDLKALAKEFGGFDKIPTSDKRYREYARQDVETLRDLGSAMLQFAEMDEYDWRENTWAAMESQISRNGFTVNVPAAKQRVEYLADRKAELLARLEADYGFPAEGKMPWRTTKGKEAILALLGDAGVVPEEDPDWERTATGNISLGGDALIAGAEGTPAEDTARLLAELMGQRSLAELALASVQNDGKVHPEIQSLQRSGRSSVTEPGLTIVNGDEKYYYTASRNCKLVSVDYSAADARAVVAMSGDTEYAKRFEPGVDAHELTGRSVFGDELYDSDPVMYRNASKPVGHGTNYNIGKEALARAIKKFSGMEVSVQRAGEILDAFNDTYHKVAAWKKKVAEEGRSGWVTNLWGRRMPVEPGRSHTQSSGLLGQSTTRETIVDACIRMLHHDIRLVTYIVAPVHDELVFDIPCDRLTEALEDIGRLMPGEVNGVAFPVEIGEPADTWKQATH